MEKELAEMSINDQMIDLRSLFQNFAFFEKSSHTFFGLNVVMDQQYFAFLDFGIVLAIIQHHGSHFFNLLYDLDYIHL